MSLLAILLGLAVITLVVMFITRREDLAYVSLVFWFLGGVQAYNMRTFPVTRSIYYYVFWACSIGMTVFCVICSVSMRRQRNTVESGEIPEKGETVSAADTDDGEEKEKSQRPRQPSVRERAERRRIRIGGEG